MLASACILYTEICKSEGYIEASCLVTFELINIGIQRPIIYLLLVIDACVIELAAWTVSKLTIN